MLNIMANVAFVEAVRRSPLSVTVPLLSLTPAFVAIFAVPLLGEVLTGREILGTALVVAGAIYLGSEGATRSVRGWLGALFRERGSLLMVVVAVCWALTMPLDKIGVVTVGWPWHALMLSLGVALGTFAIMLWMGWWRELGDLKPAVLPALGAGILVSSLALGLQLAAIHVVFVGLVEAIKRAIGNLMALVFGRLFFGEAITLQRVVALAVMAAGVAFILG